MKRAVLVVLILVAIVLLAFVLYNVSSPLAMYPDEAKMRLRRGQFDSVVDVRTDAEWNTGHYPLAIHIPTGQLEQALPQRIPDKQAKILFYCNTSTRSRMAAEQAQKLGYTNVRYLVGTHLNLL
jgi:phage shock protein E